MVQQCGNFKDEKGSNNDVSFYVKSPMKGKIINTHLFGSMGQVTQDKASWMFLQMLTCKLCLHPVK